MGIMLQLKLPFLSQVSLMLIVSLSVVIPMTFRPIVTAAIAELPLLVADLDITYQSVSVILTLQLDAVQVEELPVYVKVPDKIIRHSSSPLLFRPT